MPQFGQDFTHYFDPLASDLPVTGAVPTSDAGTGTPKIYVFSTYPSMAAAKAGTGAVQTVSGWAPSGGGFSYAVAALPDPDPAGPAREYTYFVAVNFVLKAGGQVQTVVNALPMERVTGSTTRVAVSDADLFAVYRHLDAVSSEAERLAAVGEATGQVRDALKAKGFRWSLIHNLHDLNRVVKYRAVCLLLFCTFQREGDKYKSKYDEVKGWYADALAALRLEYDATGDGAPDAVEAPPAYTLVVR